LVFLIAHRYRHQSEAAFQAEALFGEGGVIAGAPSLTGATQEISVCWEKVSPQHC
jgi:hypothetical protein